MVAVVGQAFEASVSEVGLKWILLVELTCGREERSDAGRSLPLSPCSDSLRPERPSM